MKILFLTQTYPRFDGDTAGPFIRDLARGLAAAGDAVTVLVPHADGVRRQWRDQGVENRSFRYAPPGFEVLGYGRSLNKDEAIRWRAGLVTPLYWLAAQRALRNLVRTGGFDLVHAHWIVPNGLIAAGAALDVPLAVGLHGSDVFLAEKGSLRGLVRRTLSQTGVLTGCSPELVDRVCALGFARDRAHVIPYGVDIQQFSPAPDRRLVWRQKLGIPADAAVALGVGRMVTKKGFHVLVELLPELLDSCPGAHLILAGSGDRLDELRARATAHTDRVHFPGAVMRDTLPDLYRCADLFVLPAVHDMQGNVDGLPNVILEGMATGLPIIATAISGIPLAVTDGKEGRLVAEGDRQGLLGALRVLLTNLENSREMGQAARRKAVAELTWEAVARRYRQAYEAIYRRTERSVAGH